jgi:hypothetical protein
MKGWIAAAVLGTALGVVYAGIAQAHHSHAMFDTSVEKQVTGTVTSFSFKNPHVFLYLDVKGEDGNIIPWAIEMSNISNMLSRGIKQTTFKVGDVVTVTVNPLKNGRPGGNYTAVRTADGTDYR